MRVGVGYSDNPDSEAAGRQAAREALREAGRVGTCDLVLLFATARHDAGILREAIASEVGRDVPIVGGGAVGAISKDRYGYAGDQVILAVFHFEGVQCGFFTEPGLLDGEVDTGRRLGRKLAANGTTPESPVLLFYDAIDRTKGDLRLIMATYLLEGLEQGLGFLPHLAGAGLQGDYLLTPTKQWLGDAVGSHHALALAFSGAVRMDCTIMHGCRPAAGPYTVTRADRQTILEINGQPALQFVDSVLGSSISPDEYPFFLIFGVNKGDKWADFNEKNYANRLCLAIDKERNGIIMFEPDLVEGTEFQIMHRSLDLGYMPPRMDELFAKLGAAREPVFALYINCAGRAAGYAGVDLEDAVILQKTLAGRVPLLGIYSGVEIAPVEGRPRGLDWTGVFCLFSVPK